MPTGAESRKQYELRRKFSCAHKLRLEPGTYTITAKISYGDPVEPIVKRREDPVRTKTQTVSGTITVVPAETMPELGFDQTRSGTFEMNLCTDKLVYTEGEEIKYFATLEYIGNVEKSCLWPRLRLWAFLTRTAANYKCIKCMQISV